MTAKPAEKISVAAGVIKRRGKILLGRRKADKEAGGRWEFPGGKIRAHENAAEALVREIREEFGLEIQVGRELAAETEERPDRPLTIILLMAETTSEPLFLTAHDAYVWAEPAAVETYDLLDIDRRLWERIKKILSTKQLFAT